MNALLQQFMLESREALEGIGSTLLAMERDPTDEARLGELFRLVHTLKGNSGLFDFPALTTVLHAAEDVMDAVRTAELDFSQTLADQLLDAADYVSLFLDEVQALGAPGEAFSIPPRVLVTQLRSWLTPLPADAVAASAPQTPAADTSLELPQAAWQALQAAASVEGLQAYWVDYQPAPDSFFQGTDPLHLVRQLPEMLWRRVRPLSPWADAVELDAYACNLRFELLLLSSEALLAEHFRYVSDQVSWQPVAADVRVQAAADAPKQVLLDPLALDVLRAQQAALRVCRELPWPSGQHLAVMRVLDNVLQCLGATALQTELQAVRAEADAEPLLAWLDAALAGFETAVAPSAPALEERAVAVAAAAPTAAPTVAAPAAASALSSPATPAARRAEEAPKVLKVEQEKIDRLMNLIGEIVVAKNGLPYLAERAEEQYGQRELSREIKAQYGVINRIAEDLQDAIMQVRMMPVSFVLQRFPRLVRDISRKLEKKVQLVLEGEETEADKAMIEALADPLVHVVRNSLDHGLESPAERLACGKPEAGTLRIRASQNGDHVVITIEDDGRGIDPQKIKAKVLGKGLLDAAALDAMSDQELINLVFLPGFSTAEQISELSGRGVGMDVVRAAIEKVGGHLRLFSQVGQGTQLSLSLPLSMAVTQVMVIESGGQRFGVPMDQVMETVRLPVSAIHTIKHQPTAQLRGRIIPLNSLNQMLAVPQAQRLNEDQEHALMVLRSSGELLGLLIDDFHGSVDIILKPMVGILGDVPGYSGTAVMGDGSILMILNPMEMFE